MIHSSYSPLARKLLSTVFLLTPNVTVAMFFEISVPLPISYWPGASSATTLTLPWRLIVPVASWLNGPR